MRFLTVVLTFATLVVFAKGDDPTDEIRRAIKEFGPAFAVDQPEITSGSIEDEALEVRRLSLYVALGAQLPQAEKVIQQAFLDMKRAEKLMGVGGVAKEEYLANKAYYETTLTKPEVIRQTQRAELANATFRKFRILADGHPGVYNLKFAEAYLSHLTAARDVTKASLIAARADLEYHRVLRQNAESLMTHHAIAQQELEHRILSEWDAKTKVGMLEVQLVGIEPVIESAERLVARVREKGK